MGTTFTLRLPDKSQCFQGFGIFDEYAVDFGFVKHRTDPTGIICQPCPPGYFSETGLSLGWGQGAFVGPAKQTALNMTVLIHPFDPPFSAIILERKKCNTNITQALKHLGKHLQTTKVFWIPCFLMPFWGSFWGMPARILV